MSITPAQCSVFIQIWVDTDVVTQGSGSEGIYIVDNRVQYGSQNEGGPGLVTACAKAQYVCWTIVAIDPNAVVSGLEIQSIGSSNAWGPTGQPEPTDGTNVVYTGQVLNDGQAGYALNLLVNNNQVNLNPSVNVTG